MPKTTLGIVGDHFRPPAKALLKVLPFGTPLQLVAEPSNPYDPNAVKVMLQSKDIPHTLKDNFEIEAAKYGFDFAQLMEQSEWQLGYIPRDRAADLAGTFSETEPTIGTLGAMTTGKPAIVVQLDTE